MSVPSWVTEYASELRAEAERRKALWPGDPLVSALPTMADELEARAREFTMEMLTLEQAASESGFSYSHLQRLIADGDIENVGETGAPRVRRSDLPLKRRRVRCPQAELGDLADEVLARRAG